MNIIYEKKFNSDFYDTATWLSFESSAYDVGYYVNKPVSIQKQLTELQNAQLGTFLITPEFRYTFDNDDFTTYYPEDLDAYKFLGATFRPKVKSDPTQVLNTFRIG